MQAKQKASITISGELLRQVDRLAGDMNRSAVFEQALGSWLRGRRRGHIYWVRVPDEPRSKRRPALVVSPDRRNALATDVIVVPVASVLRAAPTHVRLRAREGGLPRPSTIKCEQITTLRRERLRTDPLGSALSPTRMAEVEKAILRAIAVPIE